MARLYSVTQYNIVTSDSVQFTEMKQSMIKRLLVTSRLVSLLIITSLLSNQYYRFFAASGRNYPTALKKLMDDDVISISHDALANLLQPIINVSRQNIADRVGINYSYTSTLYHLKCVITKMFAR